VAQDIRPDADSEVSKKIFLPRARISDLESAAVTGGTAFAGEADAAVLPYERKLTVSITTIAVIASF
jgi:hypothetical protein